MNPARQLSRGVKQLRISISDAQQTALLQFVQLLQEWNKRYNLTTIVKTEEIINKHILDSLSVMPYLAGNAIIDVGSGAGFPGIPLACACADKNFLLLDASAKKTAFIQQAIIAMRLKNAQVVQARVEQYAPAHEFDTVVARAFADSAKLFTTTCHLLTQGHFILMLGKQTQVQNLPDNCSLIGVYAVSIPNQHASRHIAVVEKNKSNG